MTHRQLNPSNQPHRPQRFNIHQPRKRIPPSLGGSRSQIPAGRRWTQIEKGLLCGCRPGKYDMSLWLSLSRVRASWFLPRGSLPYSFLGLGYGKLNQAPSEKAASYRLFFSALLGVTSVLFVICPNHLSLRIRQLCLGAERLGWGGPDILCQDSGFKWLSYSAGYITDPCQEAIKSLMCPFNSASIPSTEMSLSLLAIPCLNCRNRPIIDCFEMLPIKLDYVTS